MLVIGISLWDDLDGGRPQFPFNFEPLPHSERIQHFKRVVKGYDLPTLQDFLNELDRRIEEDRKGLEWMIKERPDTQNPTACFPDWDLHLEAQEILVTEIAKRFSRFTITKPKKPKTDPLPKKHLPPLEEVLVHPDKLPMLWVHLVRNQRHSEKRFFDDSGYIGTKGRSAAPLLGLANGLARKGEIQEGYNEKDVYLILCRRFNVNPTKQLSRAKKRAHATLVARWVVSFVFP